MPRGQWEGAAALGLGRGETLRHVILPQALRSVLPALGGQFISMIKDSAMVSLISVPELTFQGRQIVATTHRSFEVWLAVAAMYLILTLCLSLLVRRLELRLAHRTGRRARG